MPKHPHIRSTLRDTMLRAAESREGQPPKLTVREVMVYIAKARADFDLRIDEVQARCPHKYLGAKPQCKYCGHQR